MSGQVDPLRRADAEQVRAVVAALAPVTWPADRGLVTRLAADLGWTVEREGLSNVDLRTGLTPAARAAVSARGDTVTRVQVDLAERADRREPTTAARVAEAYAALLPEVTAALGLEPTPAARREGHEAWDLPTGGRLSLEALSSTVVLVLLQQEWADVERSEEALGISPDRVPGPLDDLA
ncbi:DUF6301 family protein [Nocardioides zeae]|uniref:DUF6301 family protein n=1 Tax=Nocardioides imazamoxiresistens TaxID=3231893 RepID=A0ABU3PUM0_9ACTN|nr:DUF6301 family protein [Nocardioides zeae]MDT9592921.1 DUF6301 family protein [Nocardioides zeae]